MNRRYYPDLLRVIAIIGVITVHAVAPISATTSVYPSIRWIESSILHTSFRWTVPMFFMISGMFLLKPSKEKDIKVFLGKRASRLFVPFLFWSIVYYILTVITEGEVFTIVTFIKKLLTNNVYYHLWYLYTLFGIYLITPIIREYVEHTQVKNIEYFLMLWFIGSSVYKVALEFLNIELKPDIPVVTGYVGYFIMGYYLDNLELTKTVRNKIYIAGVISFIAQNLLVIILSTNEKIAWYFYGEFQPTNILIVIALFLFVKEKCRDKENQKVTKLSRYVFGMYLVHPAIFWLLRRGLLFGFKIDNYFINPVFAMLINSALTIIISFITVKIMFKIKYIKNLVM